MSQQPSVVCAKGFPCFPIEHCNGRGLWIGWREEKELPVRGIKLPRCCVRRMWCGDAKFSRDVLLKCKTVLIYTGNKDTQD
jgi:hypothetical protein